MKDLTGKKFGKLTALYTVRVSEGKGKRTLWLCRCDCGKEVKVRGDSLLNGSRISCGCAAHNSHPYYGKPTEDLTGEKFGRWTVLSKGKYEPEIRRQYWACRCDCGTVREVSANSLRSGRSQSCGCLMRDLARKRILEKPLIPPKDAGLVHGLAGHRLYKVWTKMKDRCYNRNNADYVYYGGRGISVCNEWKDDIKAFYDWAMANGYDENAPKGQCTLDRIDVNGNYEPSNCRWVSMDVQLANTRRNRFIEFNGERKTMSQWERDLGFSPGVIEARISRYGWSVERALTQPIRKSPKRGAG